MRRGSNLIAHPYFFFNFVFFLTNLTFFIWQIRVFLEFDMFHMFIVVHLHSQGWKSPRTSGVIFSGFLYIQSQNSDEYANCSTIIIKIVILENKTKRYVSTSFVSQFLWKMRNKSPPPPLLSPPPPHHTHTLFKTE